MFLLGEEIKGERLMSAEGSSVKGSNQQSSTSFPNVKGGGPLFSGPGPLITGGLVNDTTPAMGTLLQNNITESKTSFHFLFLINLLKDIQNFSQTAPTIIMQQFQPIICCLVTNGTSTVIYGFI